MQQVGLQRGSTQTETDKVSISIQNSVSPPCHENATFKCMTFLITLCSAGRFLVQLTKLVRFAQTTNILWLLTKYNFHSCDYIPSSAIHNSYHNYDYNVDLTQKSLIV